MISEDKLWKGIIDNFAAEAIALTFPEPDKTLDLSIKPEFLDKELEQIYTVDSQQPSTKIADKLMKVYTLKGDGDYVLAHIEVQAKYYRNIGGRMLTYFYRIHDIYQKPITALIIFTENITKKRSNYFNLDYMGTSLSYKFNTYKITDQKHSVLEKHTNPFAIVIMAAKMKGEAMRIENLADRDQEFLNVKLDLITQLIAKQLDPDKEKMLFTFIREYIHLEYEENKTKFTNEVDKLTKDRNTMGIIEVVLIETKLEGILEGKLEGKLEGRLEEKIDIAIEMKKDGMSIEQIMKFTKLSAVQIEKAG